MSVQQVGIINTVATTPAWAWACEQCGWLGTGLISQVAAERELRRHQADEHHPDPTTADHEGDAETGPGWLPHESGCWVCDLFISRAVTEASMAAPGRMVQMCPHRRNPTTLLLGGAPR